MRQIKFRAWDKFNQMMWYQKDSIGLFFTNMEELIDGENGISYMQFTGLHDKNGKEIYEGDIMGANRVGGVIDVIGKVLFDIDFASFVIEYTNGGWSYLWEHLNNSANEGRSVIGNIHENPELLTDKNEAV